MNFHLSVSLISLVFFGYAEAAVARYSPRTNYCSIPDFPNGQVKVKLFGSAMTFECNEGYTLVGLSYMFCKEAVLEPNIPKCIKPCDELPAVSNGFIFYEKRKAVATLYCSIDYEVEGSSYSMCNGTHWDRAIGSCRRIGLAKQTSCDFEVEDWCGWTSDVIDEFNWKRSAGIVTGPKHDHTTGNPLDGHFLMVESSEQLSNLTTRLISPIFTANYSQSGCFRFFYYMYGDSVGTLSVYVRPLSKQWCEVITADAEFSVNGSQGNAWNQAFFDLPEQNDDFRIVFAVSLGIKSVMAIDDVSLLSGLECNGLTTTDVTPTLLVNSKNFPV